MSYNTQAYNTYILNAIDSEPYDVVTNTDQEKIDFVRSTFESEKGWEINQVGYQKAIESWLSGLQSVIDLPWKPMDVLEFARSMGDLGEHASEKEEDLILSNYFRFMANKVYKLIKPNYNKKLN